MPTRKLSDFEIGKITEIVAGRMGANLDAKTLRHIVDQVVDSMLGQNANPEIEGVTCEVPRQKPQERAPYPASPLPPRPQASYQPKPPDQAMTENRGGLYEQIEKTDATRVIIAAFGKNRPGVVASITKILAELNCSIEDISQTLMQDFFSMIMIVDISGCSMDFQSMRDRIKETEASLGMQVYVMHEDIFRYMHRI